MHPFLRELRSSLPESELPGTRLMLGVSGGADSVAMLSGLLTFSDQFSMALQVAHYHHGTRTSADDDQTFVRQLCEEQGIPFHTNSPVKETRRDEATLRDRRYQFLVESATTTNCSVLCLAHQADDQVETVLHHLLRGSRLRGLAGMPRERELTSSLRLYRPLLRISREMILDFLKDRQQPFRDDPTNIETDYTRNRIRQELIPVLETYNANVSGHLLALSEQIRDVNQFHRRLVRECLDASVLSRHEECVRLLVEPFLELPRFLQKECCIELWSEMNWPRGSMTADDWERIASLVSKEAGHLDLPAGFQADRRARMLVFTRSFSSGAFRTL